jgi:DNA-directed RNA polymerase specialized sigma24 family protein
MIISGKTSLAPAAGTASAPRDRDQETYDRHAAGLYQQALLTLGDAGMAEQVVSDVIVDECVHPPSAARSGDDTGHRLAVSAYHRCQALADGPGWHDRIAARWPHEYFARCIDPGGLSGKERGALGLVLFGGLGYAQVGDELEIPPLDVAGLLHRVLHRLANSAPDLTRRVLLSQAP